MSGTADRVESLERGEAFVHLSGWWKVGVEGTDAHGWLNDLLSVELDGIAAGESRRSFLLTPTGRIRAAVAVTKFGGGYLLLQDPGQPSRIDSLLDPYVLSSDVRMRDRSDELDLFSFPGGDHLPVAGPDQHSPSVLGPGADLVVEANLDRSGLEGLVEAGPEDVEIWRVRHGVARFGVDLTPDALPHEVELGDVIAYGKGCFLGQEAVARVRNLGHPPFVLLAADADGPAVAGDKVLAEERDAGTVTSAAPYASGRLAVIARVRWALKDAPLRTASGVDLRSRGLSSAA
ncbi:MAG: YgfZ/GcvT domain-containing protein [Actinomycetota bacterium]